MKAITKMLFSYPLKLVITVIGILSFASVICAQTLPTSKEYPTPPPPAAAREAAVAAPIERVLSNGLRVITAQRKGLPIVTAQLLVLSGSEVDPKGLAGLAEITTALLTKGTRAEGGEPAMSATQIAQAAEALGGSLESGSNWHQSLITMTVTTPKLPDAIRLIAASATRPAFDVQELERLRTQTIDGLSVTLADPGRVSGFAASRLVFGDQTYGNTPIGTPASLKRITRAEVLKQHQQTFRPSNAVLILSGDIDADTAEKLAKANLGKWKASSAPASASAVIIPQPSKTAEQAAELPPAYIIDMPEAGQAGVSIAWQSVARSSPDYYQGLVSNAVLGNGYSSRLNQEIRIKRGLSYGAGSVYQARKATGLQRASAQTKNESALEVVQLIEAEISKLASAAPGEEELSARKATLIGSFSRNLETTQGLASEIAGQLTGGANASAITEVISRITAVKAEEASAFAKTYASPAKQRIVVTGDARKFGEAMLKLKPKTLTVPVADMDLEAATLRAK